MRVLAGVMFATLALSACATPGEPAGAQALSAVAPVESKFAQNGEVRIHYVASGKGPLVVMIHGYPDYSGSWDLLRPVLDDSYRVVAVDTRGYNPSDTAEGGENSV